MRIHRNEKSCDVEQRWVKDGGEGLYFQGVVLLIYLFFPRHLLQFFFIYVVVVFFFIIHYFIHSFIRWFDQIHFRLLVSDNGDLKFFSNVLDCSGGGYLLRYSRIGWRTGVEG